jgi:hypothetical protein
MESAKGMLQNDATQDVVSFAEEALADIAAVVMPAIVDECQIQQEAVHMSALMESAKGMLKNYATPDLVSVAEATIADIAAVVMPAIVDECKIQQESVHTSALMEDPVITKSQTCQLGEMQFNNICQERYWTAAGLVNNTPADRQATTPSFAAHMHVRDDLDQAYERISKSNQTTANQQGQCGSCWSFSATRGTEEPWQHVGATLLLSEKQLIDCSRTTTLSPPSSTDEARALVCPLLELTEIACVPTETCAPDEQLLLAGDQEEPKARCAPDELINPAGDQEEPTAVIKVPIKKPEVAHAPEEKELIAVARAPEEQTNFVRAPGQPNAVVCPPD